MRVDEVFANMRSGSGSGSGSRFCFPFSSSFHLRRLAPMTFVFVLFHIFPAFDARDQHRRRLGGGVSAAAGAYRRRRAGESGVSCRRCRSAAGFFSQLLPE